jgi:YNFM family putative membrane transporter
VTEGIARGTAEFRRTNLALFADGLATFALMYAVQPLMPVFSAAFGVTPAAAALSLSVTTLPLAVAMLAASVVADRVGRRTLMVGSLFASALLGLACATPTGFAGLLALRAAMGLSLAGLPAVSMAYVAEEMAPGAAGLAMGLFIGGSAIGGMSGRLLAGALTAWFGWRAALGGIGLLGLVCGVLLWRFLPPSQHFHPRPMSVGALAAACTRYLRDPVLRMLFAQGFLLMGGFVTIYNYTAYRLLAPPYALGQGRVGLIFSVYLVGVASSAIMGHLAVRAGRRRVLIGNLAVMAGGLALTSAAPLMAIVGGTALFTAGFFGAHSVASGWVGFCAREARAQASALYLFAYYAGSSLVGTAGGLVWARLAWPGVALSVAALLGLALLAATRLPGRDLSGSAEH